MIELNTILLPTDFSECSDVAAKYAMAFAESLDASLRVIHVLEDPEVYARKMESLAVVPELRNRMMQQAQQQLQMLLTDVERTKFDAQLVVRWGAPFVEIIRYARTQNVDLIVMGTHGRGPIAQMLLGSVAQKVVRKAPCPVLTVRNPEHEFVMP